MYLRLGWVVGNAGMVGALLIVVIAHVISISTGLSISSIATDKKIGAGGVYYVLSRSLGLPIGGAIGLTLFTGTAMSIALYLVGFSESFNAYIGLPSTVDNLRISGSLALLVLTILAFISTSIAIKTQYFILAAIVFSLVAIFAGHSTVQPETIPAFGGSESVPLELVFAVFFPAVTGFTAGIAMSGDLRDPKKSIPAGTIGAIAVGFVIYIGLVLFIGFKVRPDILVADNNILMKIALFAPAVIAGIWGATLSSALGGILGGPRILQAMSVDQITPLIFGKGVGPNKEPRNALILTVIIAECGILLGELDLIARIVSMFYLAAYGFINIAFFLERWASTDFNPSFKVKKWVGLVGFAATFAVMFKLDMLAMFAAIAIIGGIYIWLAKKEIALGTGDVWQSVWSSVVKSGLRRMAATDDHKRNWKPNILLFSGSSEARPHLLEFSKSLAGRTGLVTNFDLIENEKAGVLFQKHKQAVQDELLQQFDIFGRQIEVQNVFKGIETIATTFGFSGLDPNTVLMGWAKNTKDPIWFAQMTQKLIDLDYNVLYLDYDKRWGFRNREQIDLWFHQSGNGPELMLQLAKFISIAPDWRNSFIRILVVNDYDVDRMIVEGRVRKLLEEYRIQAEIKVVNNQVEQKPFYEIMKILSADADLIFIGIPDIEPDAVGDFVQQTNDLVSVIGTTLLVKASSTFPMVHLGLLDIGKIPEVQKQMRPELLPIAKSEDEALENAIQTMDNKLHQLATSFSNNTVGVIQQHYAHFCSRTREQIIQMLDQLEQMPGQEGIWLAITNESEHIIHSSEQFSQDTLPLLRNILDTGVPHYKKSRVEIFKTAPGILWVATTQNGHKQTRKIKWRKILRFFNLDNGMSGILLALREHSSVHANLLIAFKNMLHQLFHNLRTEASTPKEFQKHIRQIREQFETDFQALQQQTNAIVKGPVDQLRNTDRRIFQRTADTILHPKTHQAFQKKQLSISAKEARNIRKEIDNYADVWIQHQNLFHEQFQVGLKLDATAMGIEKAIGEAVQQLRSNYFENLHQYIRSLQDTLPGMRESLNSGKPITPPASDLITEEERSFNFELVSNQMLNTIGVLTDKLPEESELMDAESLQGFPAIESGEIKEVLLAVNKISDYIIETTLLKPFHQKLLAFNNEIRQIRSKVYNTATLLVYDLNNAQETQHTDELKGLLDTAEQDLKDRSDEVDQLIQKFEAEIRERVEATSSLLEIRNMISQATELSQYARKRTGKFSLTRWREQLNKLATQFRRQTTEYISKKRDDVALAGYAERYRSLKGNQVLLRNFVEEIIMPEAAEEVVPLYYRHLFSGKQLSPGPSLENRKNEVAEAEKAIKYIRKGIAGGILVAGESLSGKSYFTEFIANQIISGKTYYITAPAGGASAESDLLKAFQSACRRKGTLKSILQNLPAGATFIFNDIELWWLKAANGNQLISKLAPLIKTYGSRHFFLLNGNLHSLQIILNTTNLQKALVSTIVLPPISQEQLKNVIWSRHQNGGLPLYYQGRLFSSPLVMPPEKVFARLFKLSEGNIGVAMRIWLAALRLSPEGHITLSHPSAKEFPNVESEELTNFLCQLFLHKSLSRNRLNQIYAYEGSAWVGQLIDELQRSTILEPPENILQEHVFSLRAEVRPYLENWLKERELI